MLARMTVATTQAETVYALAGTALGAFNTVWPYNAPSDVICQLDYGDGAGLHLLVQGADYMLTANNPTLSNGGSVTLAAYILSNWGAAWGPGAELAVVRITPRAQPSSFGEATGFSPQASEQAIDNLARQIQELTTQMARCVKVEYGETPPVIVGGAVDSSLWGVDAGGAFLSFVYGGSPGALIGTDGHGALTFYPPASGAVTGPAPFVDIFANATLHFGGRYWVDSSAGPVILTLDPLAAAGASATLEVYCGNAAALNNVTIQGAGADQISFEGQVQPSLLVQVNGVFLIIRKLGAVACALRIST